MWGIAFGADCNLYVSYQGIPGAAVAAFNGATDALIGVFVPADPARNGGLLAPGPMTFGPDGSLYVTNGTRLVRYDVRGQPQQVFSLSTTAANFITFSNGMVYLSTNLGVFDLNVQTGATARFVDIPFGFPAGITFGPDGHFYAVRTVLGEPNLSDILRFTSRGESEGVFVPQGSSGGLGEASGLAFGGDRNLYVLFFAGNRVLRYSGSDGSSARAFAAIPGPGGLPFQLAFKPLTCPR